MKLLVLGSTGNICEIIRKAKDLGIYTLAADYFEKSEGKLIADKACLINANDIDGIVSLIEEEEIDGVVTGFADSILRSYYEICEKAEKFCYLSRKLLDMSLDKEIFKKVCSRYGVGTVKGYGLVEDSTAMSPEDLDYPVIVKPVDNSGGRGIRVLGEAGDLSSAIEYAMGFSDSKRAVVEKYAEGREVTAFYIAMDGRVYLSGLADRHVKNKQEGLIPIPAAYLFPSDHLSEYLLDQNDRVVKMLEGCGFENGLVFIQGHVEEGRFSFYEMGHRLSGTMEYKVIERISGYNSLDMIISHALTGKMGEMRIGQMARPDFKKQGAIVTYSLKPGTIGSIDGMDIIEKLDQVVDMAFSYKKGDEIPPYAVGTLGQVFLRVYVVAETRNGLMEVIGRLNSTIRVFSDDGEDMLMEPFCENDI